MRRRLIYITLLTSSLLIAGIAQARPEPPGDPEARFARLVTLLELSADQQPKVRAILEAGQEQRRQLEQASRAEHDELRDQTAQKLAVVLSTEQMARFKALMAERRHGPPPGQKAERRD